MRDPNRIDGVLHTLGEVWKKYPDMRLGQLIVNATMNNTVHQHFHQELFYLDDKELIKRIKDYLTDREMDKN